MTPKEKRKKKKGKEEKVAGTRKHESPFPFHADSIPLTTMKNSQIIVKYR